MPNNSGAKKTTLRPPLARTHWHADSSPVRAVVVRAFSYLDSGWEAKLGGRPTAPRPAASWTPLFSRFSGLPFPFFPPPPPLLLLLCTIKYQQASFTRRRSGFHPNLIAWLAFYPPFSRRPPPPPPLVCDNATKPGLKKLTLSWTARLRSPTCCAVVPDSVDTKRSCGLYHEKV